MRSLVDESRVEMRSAGFDIPGAVLITGGLALFVYAISQAPTSAGRRSEISLIVALGVLVALRPVWERASPAPLMPLGFFSDRLTAAANGISFLLAASIYSNFFVLTLYMQNVLDYSALQAGSRSSPPPGPRSSSRAPSQALVTRIGVKPVLVTGLVLLPARVALVHAPAGRRQVPVRPADPVHRLRRGIALSFIPLTIAALAGAPEHEAGLASGLINTSQQIGGAIGLAIVSTVVYSHAEGPFVSSRKREPVVRSDRGLPARLHGDRADRRAGAARRGRLHPAATRC